MHKNPSDQDIVEVETSKKSKKNNRIKQSSIMMSVLPLAACGGVPSGDNLTFSPNFVEDPVNVFVAVDDNDRTLSQSDNTASLTVTGKAGNDSITTGSGADTIIGGDGDDTINSNDGNDLIRAGNGSDTVSSGAGDDAIVIVGTTAPGQYDTAAITNSAGSGTDLSSLITLADLNDRSVSEVNAGEVIDGGTGTNTLFIYGTVDLTSVTLNNVTVLVVNSDVTLTSGQMALFSTVDGDGSSVLNIEIPAGSPDTYVLDLSLIDISDIASISISGDMTIKIDDADDLAVIGRITNGASDALKVEVSASNAPITINLGDITNVIENVDVIELGDNVVLEITDPADITDLGLTEIEGDGEIDVGGNSAIQNELDTSVTVTIIQSALSIDNISANEAQQASQFTVSLSKPSLLTVTVDYNAPDGSSGTLTFDPGDVQKTFSSTWTDDSTDEVDEVVSAVLSNSQNATISDASGNLTILNDDNPPTISIDDISANEIDESDVFTVSLSEVSGRTVTVDYNAPDGSSGTLTFDPGDIQKTFSSTWTNDAIDEVDEVVSATLSNPTNATILDASGDLTIVDDDNPPTISIDDISANEADESDIFTVTLSEASGRTVTVDYNAPDGSSGTLTFNAGDTQKTFSSAWTNDTLDEVDEVVSAILPTRRTPPFQMVAAI